MGWRSPEERQLFVLTEERETDNTVSGAAENRFPGPGKSYPQTSRILVLGLEALDFLQVLKGQGICEKAETKNTL